MGTCAEPPAAIQCAGRWFLVLNKARQRAMASGQPLYIYILSSYRIYIYMYVCTYVCIYIPTYLCIYPSI